MDNLDDIIDKIEDHIDEKEKIREQALRSSRDIIIDCRKAIQRLHQDKKTEAKKHIKQASIKIEKLNKLTKNYPDIYHAGYVENASQEFVEANCFYNIIHGKELPDPDTLQTSYRSYLLGLCDVVGELRRGALDFILESKSDDANEYLKLMEKIYDVIMRFDYPSSFVPVKKKQDMIRALIEKTRGELVVASCEQRIDDKTDEFRGLIDRITTEKKKAKQKHNEDIDINIDDVW